MTLSDPPDDPTELEAFPRIQLWSEAAYRIFRYRDPETGRVRGPFYFASTPGDRAGSGATDGSEEGAESASEEEADPASEEGAEPASEEGAEPAEGRGRYDLPPPHGSCYLAREKIGAWLETFRSTYVALDDLRARRMLTTRPPYSLRAAEQGERMPYGWRWRIELGRLEDDRALLREAARYGYRALAVPFDVTVQRP